MMLSSVVLPQPLGPVMASISPASTLNEKSRKTAFSPNDLYRFCTSMTGMVCPSPFPKSSVVPGRAQPPLSVRSTLVRSLCRMNAAAAHSSSSAAPSESGSTAQSLSSSALTR